MSPSDREFEELLSRALHAAVDPVEPAEDGLDRIRARLATPYSTPIAWIMTVSSAAARTARDALEGTRAWLRTWRAPAGERSLAALPGRLGPASVLAVAGLAVAASVLALTSLSPHLVGQTVASILAVDNGGGSFQGGGPVSGPAGSGLNGHGAKFPSAGAGVSPPVPGQQNQSPTATASCAATASALTRPASGPAASPEPAPCPTSSSATTAPTPTPSPSPSPSTTPTPTPSPNSTPNQGGGASQYTPAGTSSDEKGQPAGQVPLRSAAAYFFQGRSIRNG